MPDKKSVEYLVQITHFRGVNIPKNTDTKEIKSKWDEIISVSSTDEEQENLRVFMLSKKSRKEWEHSAENIFNEKPELVPLFVCGTAIEVFDNNQCIIGLQHVRSMISTNGNVCLQVEIFPTGVPG